ncbi:MAG: phosphatase PAP2 family protein [Bdellovibrionales bacterium]|nr:phosphatase PAP2 family protein [Massilia sp.]
MERRIFLKLTTGAALSSALAACGGDGGSPGRIGDLDPTLPPRPASGKIVLGWNTVALDAIRATNVGAPMAARALAVVHTSMYDAWAAYDKVALGTRHGATLRRPLVEQTPAKQMRAVSFAAYAALLDQFPTQKAAVDAHMATLGYNPAAASNDPTLPEGIGAIVALSVLTYAHADGSNQLGTMTASGIPFADYSGYAPCNAPLVVALPTPRSAIAEPGHWQPLSFKDPAGVVRSPGFLVPFWRQVRPFGLTSGAQFRPPPPDAFGTPAFDDQARQVVQAQAALTEIQKVMVEYWAGGANGELPSGYRSVFAQFISQRDNHTEEADIKMFFALSNALFDAGIAAWDAKRCYDSARPITAIRYLYSGQVVQSYGPDGPSGALRAVAGEQWVPFQQSFNPTPSHPEFVSGHSTYSAASAAALRLFTGSDAFSYRVTLNARSLLYDPSLPVRDVTLAWDTFSAAATQAGISRVYGGIHFPCSDLAGRALGEQVGVTVFAKAQAYWLGS